MAIRIGRKKRASKQSRKKDRSHDHMDTFSSRPVPAQLNRRETFYHFGNISIDYNGRGRQSCELHIIADGARLGTFDFVAKDGRDFSLPNQWLMAGNACILVTTKNRREVIFKLDVPRPTNTVSNPRSVSRTSGDYYVEYRVFRNTQHRNRIQYQLAQFEASTRPSAWKNVDKAKLIADLRQTTDDPREVNQEAAGFCGATAIGYAMAVSQPHRLVQYCQELYENGSMRGAEKTFRASSKFRNSLVPGSQRWTLSLTDYVFTGTLMEDAGFKRQEYREKLKKHRGGKWEVTQNYNAEGNMSGAQKRWCRELLGYWNDRGIGDKFPLGKQVKALAECRRVLNAKGFVFPAIHADILKETSKKSVVKISNHWVTMTDIRVFDNKGKVANVQKVESRKIHEVEPTFFTWGEYYKGRLDKSHYKKFVWLYIVCEPFTKSALALQIRDVR